MEWRNKCNVGDPMKIVCRKWWCFTRGSIPRRPIRHGGGLKSCFCATSLGVHRLCPLYPPFHRSPRQTSVVHATHCSECLGDCQDPTTCRATHPFRRPSLHLRHHSGYLARHHLRMIWSHRPPWISIEDELPPGEKKKTRAFGVWGVCQRMHDHSLSLQVFISP